MSSHKRARSRRQTTDPPSWRQRTLSKAPSVVEASVSKVFADPVQGKPFESAAAALPASVLLDDALERKSELSGDRDPSPDSNTNGPMAILSKHQPSHLVLPTSVDGSKAQLTESPESATDLPLPPDPEPPRAPRTPPKKKSSWFAGFAGGGSLKAKGSLKSLREAKDASKDEAVVHVQPPTPEFSPEPTAPTTAADAIAAPATSPTPTPTSTAPLRTASTPPSPAPLTSSNAKPRPIPSRKPSIRPPTRSRTWFSTSPSTSSLASPSTSDVPPAPNPSQSPRSAHTPPSRSPLSGPPTSPYHYNADQHPPSCTTPTPRPARPQHLPSIPSSIDEQVPHLLTPPTPAPAPQPTPSITHTAVDTNRNLNPASSRFTLSIPLLGRPKVPLERAVEAAKKEDVREGGEAQANGDGGLMTPIDKAIELAREEDVRDACKASETPEPPSPPSTQPTTTTVSEQMAAVDEATGENEEGHPQRQGSWWDYVGWGYGSGVQGQDPSKTEPPPGSDSQTQLEPQSEPATTPSSETTAAPDTPTTPAPPTSLAPPKPSSITSAHSAQSQGSSWYAYATYAVAPWTWYYGTGTGGEQAQEGEGEDGEGKTESERVKEAALARDEADSPHTSTSSSTQTPPQPEPETHTYPPNPSTLSNPIEGTITTHRTGWTSFFTSNAMLSLSRGVEAGEREGGVERDEEGNEVMVVEEEGGKPEGGKAVGVKVEEVTVEKGSAAAQGKKDEGGGRAKEKEPKKEGPVQEPLTGNESVKKEVTKPTPKPAEKPKPADKEKDKPASRKPTASPAPSTRSSTAPPSQTPPNLVLPTWTDTFHAPPRSLVPPRHVQDEGKLKKTWRVVSKVGGALWSGALSDDESGSSSKSTRGRRQSSVASSGSAGSGKGKGRQDHTGDEWAGWGKALPRAFDVLGDTSGALKEGEVWKGCKKVVVIGIHGWFPGAVMRTVLGEPTGTSSKFVNMMCQALEDFEPEHGIKLEKVTRIPLEGEGTIGKRVEKLYKNLISNSEWLDDLHAADAIFVATHSQGSIVSTHLLDRLIRDRHIRTSRTLGDVVLSAGTSASPGGTSAAPPFAAAAGLQPQKVCCLALCGIHLGPLRYLSSSSLLQPYIQYFESSAARELFDFQDTESSVSIDYVNALRNVTNHGTKMVYVASLNDQVVPIYSGLFTSASHPLILRALYIDGDAYSSSDFLSNLTVLLIRILNAGLSDSGLLVHLSEATAGSLSGVGHSTAYEELSTFSLAVKYLFLTDNGLDEHPELDIQPFKASEELNDYEIPWALRDLIADERVVHFFWREFAQLKGAFDDWHPKTTILRDIKRKLQPIQRLHSAASTTNSLSSSKL